MAKRKVFTAEQIIMKLREAEVLLGQGKSVKEASRVLEISEQTYYRWRVPYSEHLGIWGTEYNPGKKAKRTGKGKCTSETSGGRPVPGQCDLPVGTSGRCEGGALKKVISPDRRHQAVNTLSGTCKFRKCWMRLSGECAGYWDNLVLRSMAVMRR
jgi:hypothetical protein